MSKTSTEVRNDNGDNSAVIAPSQRSSYAAVCSSDIKVAQPVIQASSICILASRSLMYEYRSDLGRVNFPRRNTPLIVGVSNGVVTMVEVVSLITTKFCGRVHLSLRVSDLI